MQFEWAMKTGEGTFLSHERYYKEHGSTYLRICCAQDLKISSQCDKQVISEENIQSTGEESKSTVRFISVISLYVDNYVHIAV
jgi:hypothetical protein